MSQIKTYAVIDEGEELIQHVPECWLTPHPTEEFPIMNLRFPGKKTGNISKLIIKADPPKASWKQYAVTVMKRGIASK